MRNEKPVSPTPKEGTIQITAKGFEGTFPWRVPTLQDETDIGVEKAALTEGKTHFDDLPRSTQNLLGAVAYMRVLSRPRAGEEDVRPSWWRESNFGMSLRNPTPIFEYLAEGGRRESRFHGINTDSRRTEEAAAEEQDSAIETSVDEEVQSSTERREVVVSHRKRAD